MWKKLKTVLVLLYGIWVTAGVSVRALIYTALHGQNRLHIDSLARNWAHKLCRFTGMKLRVIDPYHFKLEPGREYIYMSNHASLFDIPIIYAAMPGSIRMLAKKELAKVPFMGVAMKATEFVFVDRKNRQNAIDSLERAKQKMLSGIVLWMAPEGTRNRDGQLLPFKKGGFMMALQTGATIVPVSLKNAHKVLPAKSLALCFDQTIEITIGEPIDASQYTEDERDVLMEKVRAAIAAGL